MRNYMDHLLSEDIREAFRASEREDAMKRHPSNHESKRLSGDSVEESK